MQFCISVSAFHSVIRTGRKKTGPIMMIRKLWLNRYNLEIPKFRTINCDSEGMIPWLPTGNPYASTSIFSKSAAPCLQTGQIKSGGSSGPS